MNVISGLPLRSEAALSVHRGGLPVVRQLLETLHEREIRYCHWKSNEHVGAALEGLTDLDILVDRRQHQALQHCLAECGFKRFAAAAQRAYPAVEDYLGFDAGSGRLSHLHLHYELTLGQRHLKGYRLPWESQVLERRIFDPGHGIYVADPAMETVLLLVRRALKHRARDILPPLRKRGDDNDYNRELGWLLERVDAEAVRVLALDLLGKDVAQALGDLIHAPGSVRHEQRFIGIARGPLRRHRTYSGMSAPMRAWWHELQWIADAVNRRILHRPVPLRRVNPRGGLVVAFLGSDGAGKSTQVKNTTRWLGEKLDVMPIYFGSGDGPASLIRLPMKLARRVLDAALARRGGAGDGSSPDRKAQIRIRSVALVPWALALAAEKRGKLRRTIEARNRGMVVVCDRFPQADHPGFNDGPLLHHLHASRWRICRALAAWEAAPFHEAKASPPDLVVKLIASPSVALARRPEMTEQEIVRRVESVQAMSFPPATRVHEISGDDSLEAVTQATRHAVWQEL